MGREYLIAQQINANLSHKITVRFVDGLNVKHRILFGTRVFSINSIANIEERDAVQVLMCTEAV